MGSSSSRIKESKTNHVPHVPLITERQSEKLYNSIVRIKIILSEKEVISGTGFFIKFNIKNKTRFFLMAYHIIQERFVNEKKVINFYNGKYNEENNLEIKLDREKRFIKCFGEPFDVTMIEILMEDYINEGKFLNLDLKYKNDYNSYLNDYFYLVEYPQNNMSKISAVKITKILKKPEFEHTLDTEHGNSGSPICLANNLSVVGIHNKRNIDESIKYGTF